MTKPEFVYTTYINTTPERLWQALTDPDFTARYWGTTFDTDWKEGSTMTWSELGVVIADSDQVVLESEPCRRLSYTWHTFTPEWYAKVKDRVSADFLDKALKERRSTVTFHIEPAGPLVKLTVVHDGFEPDSVVRQTVSEGWPHLLSSLKSLLETGEALPDPESVQAGAGG